MLRFRVSLTFVAAALLSWPLATHGQRLPTRSPDLAQFAGDRVRVIVQADDAGLSSVRGRLGRALRRNVEGALALELTRSEFEALARDGGLSHISKDLPVFSDMAVTNKTTRAESVWQGTSGLLLGIGG